MRLASTFGVFALSLSAAWADEAGDLFGDFDPTTYTPPDRLWGAVDRLTTPAVLAEDGYSNTSSAALTLADGGHVVISFWVKEGGVFRNTQRCVTWHMPDFVEVRAGCAFRLSPIEENGEED